ncbi:MAG TPA: rod shape-determining protein MreD [Vicinamibacterales bacterium]|nr:rod shape-determining protein MreD [Vicinamibacterales bacterium]
MKLTAIVATVVVAALLQVALARYTAGGRLVFDFVLVGVVFAALQWGPVAGILGGTIGGLLQDVLAGGIVGVGGLAKTIVGCGAGVIGAQFVLVRPSARMIIVAGATLVHRLIVFGLLALIDQHWPGLPVGAMLAETAVNAIIGLVAFHAAGVVPGLVARQRASRRSTLSRRRW